MIHKELNIWKRSITLVIDIYQLTSLLPESEKFGLCPQMRRAVVSIPSNIAEGAGRSSTKEYLRFLDIATGSLSELETQLIICEKLSLLSVNQEVFLKIRVLNKMFYRLKKVLMTRI